MEGKRHQDLKQLRWKQQMAKRGFGSLKFPIPPLKSMGRRLRGYVPSYTIVEEGASSVA